jgi:hypothetical protein
MIVNFYIVYKVISITRNFSTNSYISHGTTLTVCKSLKHLVKFSNRYSCGKSSKTITVYYNSFAIIPLTLN